MRVVGRPAHEVFGHVEGEAPPVTEPADDLADLGHDLGADAVAGKDEKAGGGHGARPSSQMSGPA
jgi:hypothetical protein